MHDLRFALRMLRRTPGVTAAAILALALGIGANTAIFSVVDGVLLRPLPFPESDRLFAIHVGNLKFNKYEGPLSYLEYVDMAAQNRSFESVGAWVGGDINLTGASSPERVLIRLITPSLLPTLRVTPMLGRNFLPEETLKGRDHVTILDYGLWQRQFHGAEDAIGKSVRLDGIDYKVVGVLPRGAELGQHVDVWLPLSESLDGMQIRNAHFLRVIGRARPEATRASITADLHARALYQSDTYPAIYPKELGFDERAHPYLDDVVGDVRLPLLVLLGAVGLVLLIACANVANLLLARATARQREMAIRAALGAKRGRLIRQLLTESLILSLGGGALGILFAHWGIDALLGMRPDSLPRVAEVGLHGRVLAFTTGVAVLTGIAFGLAPALAASRGDLQGSLKDGTRGTTAGRGRLRRALVVAEVALSLVVLVGAGLMVRSFARLRAVDPGFRPEGALMLRVSRPLPDNLITDEIGAQLDAWFARAIARLRQLPGVSAVGAASALPLDGNQSDRLFEIEGAPAVAVGNRPDADISSVTSGWFTAMGIPLVQGRVIEDGDTFAAPAVVVVNQHFARQFFADGNALGKRIRLGRMGKEPSWATIIGVVGDAREGSLDEPLRPHMYWAAAQIRQNPTMAIVARTAGNPHTLATTVRATMSDYDPAQPIFDLQPLEHLVSASLGQRRFTLTLMLLFAIVALVLAAVGIYGVMAYTVAQRTQEIGIRVALGARPAGIVGMVLKDGMSLVGLGLAVGCAAALALTRLASSLLYGVSAADGATYAVIAGTLAGVAALAILLPARRAMRVDPMQALRAE